MSIFKAILDFFRPLCEQPLSDAELATKLDALAAGNPEKLEWRMSIVDLMKPVEIDSGLSARRQLAQELGYAGSLDDSATMNTWLHAEIMRQLADHAIPISAPDTC